MRRLLAIWICFSASMIWAQGIDITAYTQNEAMKDTSDIPLTTTVRQTASYPEISEVYQIPAYDLYQQFWDVNHLRSKKLEIPFSNDRLMLILVQSGNNPFEFPCGYDEVIQSYGPSKKGIFHPGIDLKVAPQTLVKSCFDGVVRMAKYYGQYGLTVVLRHYNGLETVYAHLDKLCVKPGQIVQVGDVIGQTGKSGNAKDYMLHFETRFMNEFFNPELMIDFENETLIKNTLVLTPTDFYITALDEMAKDQMVAPKPATQPVMPKSETTPVPKSEPTPQVVAPDFDGEEYHVVKKGETLYRIATAHGTTPENIIHLNNIQNANMIQEGQRLRVK